MSVSKFYAHSLENDQNREHWHLLSNHLHEVATLAGKMAAEFGCGEWGYLAGLWHDLGNIYERRFCVYE